MGPTVAGLAEIFLHAARGSAEVTLRGVCDLIGVADDLGTLERSLAAKALIESYGLELIPGFDKGSFDSVRLIRFRDAVVRTPADCAGEIDSGESQCMEFKSSLLYDHKKATGLQHAKQSPNTHDLKSEEVLLSALKTICAFLNCDGGVLYIGVTDQQAPVGLTEDLSLLGPNANLDKWLLTLKNYMQSRFKDGNTVNDYVEAQFVQIDGVIVARLAVTERSALSFVRDKSGAFCCYRRQGNRTVLIDITEFEEFLQRRYARQASPRRTPQ